MSLTTPWCTGGFIPTDRSNKNPLRKRRKNLKENLGLGLSELTIASCESHLTLEPSTQILFKAIGAKLLDLKPAVSVTVILFCWCGCSFSHDEGKTWQSEHFGSKKLIVDGVLNEPDINTVVVRWVTLHFPVYCHQLLSFFFIICMPLFMEVVFLFCWKWHGYPHSILKVWPSLWCICVSTQWYGCQCLRFVMCARMPLMHAILHRAVVESALKVDSEKNPLLHQGIEPAWAVHSAHDTRPA